MTARKCKNCGGSGLNRVTARRMDNGSSSYITTECPKCEGSGIELRSKTEEQFDDASELNGTKIYQDEESFIDLEEEDYEV